MSRLGNWNIAIGGFEECQPTNNEHQDRKTEAPSRQLQGLSHIPTSHFGKGNIAHIVALTNTKKWDSNTCEFLMGQVFRIVYGPESTESFDAFTTFWRKETIKRILGQEWKPQHFNKDAVTFMISEHAWNELVKHTGEPFPWNYRSLPPDSIATPWHEEYEQQMKLLKSNKKAVGVSDGDRPKNTSQPHPDYADGPQLPDPPNPNIGQGSIGNILVNIDTKKFTAQDCEYVLYHAFRLLYGLSSTEDLQAFKQAWRSYIISTVIPHSHKLPEVVGKDFVTFLMAKAVWKGLTCNTKEPFPWGPGAKPGMHNQPYDEQFEQQKNLLRYSKKN